MKEFDNWKELLDEDGNLPRKKFSYEVLE